MEKDIVSGSRRGRGKPLGWRKPEGIRKLRTTKAYDDEWELLQRFDKLVKHGNRKACEEFLAKMEATTK